MNDKTQVPQVMDVSQKFIDLANQLKDQGLPPALVSSALMQASAIYATYAAAGNEGYLQPSGVERVASVYRAGLAELQKFKRANLEAQGLKPKEQ